MSKGGAHVLRSLGRGLIAALASIMLAALSQRAWAVDGVVLYVSPTTQAYFPSAGGRYEAMVKPWRDLLAAPAYSAREVSRPEDLAGLSGAVLVLPSAVALSDLERRALLRFRHAGGSILATWATGTRDAYGRWLGFDFVRELMGFTVTGEIEHDAQTRFLIPYGDTPVNQALPAGRRIWLGQPREKALRLKGGVEAAAYLDWTRSVFTVGDHHGAIVFDEAASSRAVMFGFAETAWDFQADDVRSLATSALQWLRRAPHARLAAWPRGCRAAQLIEMDTEEGFGHAIHFAELLQSMNATGTFYSLTSEARKNAALVRQLAGKHEIGFHGEVHIGFKGLARDKQQARLDRMLGDMHEVLGTADGWPRGAGRGFRAPTESYDDTTESLLRALGFRHHVADPNRSQDRLPLFSPPAAHDRDTALVVLPRSQLDDLNYIQKKLDSRSIGPALIAEYEMNLRMAGLGILSVHSQNFADPNRLLGKPLHNSLMTSAMEDLARHVGPRHEPVWIASGGTIAQWWRERSRASVATRADGAELDIDLSVSGTAPLAMLTLLVDHAREGPAALVQALGAGSPRPEVRRLDRFSSALVFAQLAPGTHRYRITFP
jgi:Polysaccharide deacetylase